MCARLRLHVCAHQFNTRGVLQLQSHEQHLAGERLAIPPLGVGGSERRALVEGWPKVHVLQLVKERSLLAVAVGE